MEKTLWMVLVTLLAFTVVGCASDTYFYTPGDMSSAPEASAEAAVSVVSEPLEPVASDGVVESASAAASSAGSNVLVAYFSVMETDGVDTLAGASRVVVDDQPIGNTEYVAQLIAQETNGDVARIETVQEYPTTHDPLLEFAYEEKAQNARPELVSVPDVAAYDTIFLGYPNWNADLPMPMYTLLEQVDMSGKTIVPFTTHGGSGFSRTVGTIQELQPNATVSSDGLSISRNNVAECEIEVSERLVGLGYGA